MGTSVVVIYAYKCELSNHPSFFYKMLMNRQALTIYVSVDRGVYAQHTRTSFILGCYRTQTECVALCDEFIWYPYTMRSEAESRTGLKELAAHVDTSIGNSILVQVSLAYRRMDCTQVYSSLKRIFYQRYHSVDTWLDSL